MYEIDNLKPVTSTVLAENEYASYRIESSISAKSNKIQSNQSAENIASYYLDMISARLQIENFNDDLCVERKLTSPAGEHIRYQAIYRGIPVYNSMVVITVANSNHVSFLSGHYRPHVNVKNMIASISAESAVSLAWDYLQVKGKLHADIKSELMIFEHHEQGFLLAYRIELPVSQPRGDWEIFVDAVGGQIIHVRDKMKYDHSADGSGRVFIPDPLRMAGVYYGGNFSDNFDQDHDSLNAQQVDVILRDITYVDALHGYILEGPYVKLADIDPEGPADHFPVLTDPDGFIFNRSQQEFEHVMVYYHIDQCYRRLESLGFYIEHLDEIRADPHGLNGEDNSYYSEFGNYCAFGEGGVDDAEDAAIIWHEYGHAIQDNIILMTYSGENKSLQEGSSDYWAVSYTRRQTDFAWEHVFLWDAGIISEQGDYAIWPGRRCDLNWRYPEDYIPFAGTHEGGQIWSSALMHIWEELGADITDELFLATIYYLSQNSGMQEAALAFVQADLDSRYGGQHLSVISYWFDFHGLINIQDFQPQIIHTSLRDTENLQGPYRVVCQITPAEAGLDSSKLQLIWRADTLFADTTNLIPDESENGYFAEIPGAITPKRIYYYLSAEDSIGQSTYSPSGAANSFYSFYAGPDTIKPQVLHTPIEDQPFSYWPVEITAEVTDNIGPDSVWMHYRVNNENHFFPVILTPVGAAGNHYTGYFFADSGNVAPEDTIQYQIYAMDSSANRNVRIVPDQGYYWFVVYEKPAPPSNLHIRSNMDLVELAWDPITVEGIYYNIYRNEDSTGFIFLDSTLSSSFIDTSVILNDHYAYYLRTVLDPWEGDPSDTVETRVESVVSIGENVLVPKKFALEQNYPNPFNPTTAIGYQLSAVSDVNLSIYNLLGQKVATLVSEKQQAGYYQVEWNASGFASGVYIYQIVTDKGFTDTKKLLLLK